MRVRYLLVSTMVASAAFGFVPASATPAWQVDLSRTGSGSTNVSTDGTVRLGSGANRAASADSALRTGIAVYPHTLSASANTFTAAVRSTVPDGTELAIDVRGRVDDSSGASMLAAASGTSQASWTEWVEIRPDAPGVLPVATRHIEVRAMLTAPDGVPSPALESLTVTASSTERPATRTATGAGLTYTVFATREGLVGGTTANGHKIVARDHFVALPSRRGLSARHAGDYSVRVCAGNGRCEWAPTWDVGPWNTRDDYWTGPGVRQEWHDLPQGKPASQAAYQDGYNGGKDQFGRRVANPAGIDLADGTFWDGLKLNDNAWVTVTYQWTGTNPAGYVRTRGGEPLNVRTGPDSQSRIVGLAANYAQVRVECAATGEQVAGTQGTTNAWYRLAAGMYASAAYISGGAAPAC